MFKVKHIIAILSHFLFCSKILVSSSSCSSILLKDLSCCREIKFTAEINNSVFNETQSPWNEYKAAFFDESEVSLTYTAGNTASDKNEVFYVRNDSEYALFYQINSNDNNMFGYFVQKLDSDDRLSDKFPDSFIKYSKIPKDHKHMLPMPYNIFKGICNIC